MDAAYKSLCPLCRRPYMHFPRICEQLHFVLLKAVREQYLVRAKEVQEEEAHAGVFSPQFDDELLQRKDSNSALMTDGCSKVEASEVLAMETETLSSFNESSESKIEDLSPVSSSCEDLNSTTGTSSLRPSSVGDSDPSVKGKAPMLDEGETDKEGNNMEGDGGLQDTSNVETGVQVSDLTCLSCSKLLHRPVVLNCGHMFCEHCVVVSDARTVSCPSCKAEHPGLFPQVCLELHHYIDKVFPLEYGQRSVEVSREVLEHPRVRPEQPAPEPETSIKELGVRRMTAGPVHRAGCDGCGMMPIVGKRYKCKDCPETIGYDLCSKCYESGCVVGRFNQRHTPEHQMVEKKILTRIARQFLDAMAHRSISITDIRIIANECDELDSMFLRNSNGVSSQNGDGNVDGNVDSNGNGNGNEVGGLEGQHSVVLTEANDEDSLADAIGDSFRHVDYVDGDTHHDLFISNGDVIEDFFGPNDEEFETFSRDDEDIEFYRVVFHA